MTGIFCVPFVCHNGSPCFEITAVSDDPLHCHPYPENMTVDKYSRFVRTAYVSLV